MEWEFYLLNLHYIFSQNADGHVWHARFVFCSYTELVLLQIWEAAGALVKRLTTSWFWFVQEVRSLQALLQTWPETQMHEEV